MVNPVKTWLSPSFHGGPQCEVETSANFFLNLKKKNLLIFLKKEMKGEGEREK